MVCSPKPTGFLDVEPALLAKGNQEGRDSAPAATKPASRSEAATYARHVPRVAGEPEAHSRSAKARRPRRSRDVTKGNGWWLAATAATPSVFVLRRMRGRTRVCIVFRAIRNIDTLFGDTS
jgi:hypothetical protein